MGVSDFRVTLSLSDEVDRFTVNASRARPVLSFFLVLGEDTSGQSTRHETTALSAVLVCV